VATNRDTEIAVELLCGHIAIAARGLAPGSLGSAVEQVKAAPADPVRWSHSATHLARSLLRRTIAACAGRARRSAARRAF
jgi:hypothetical protein